MYTNSKRIAVILGCSKTIWNDYKLVLSKYDRKDLVLFAVNDISIHLNEPVDHIVSLHTNIVNAFRTIHNQRYSSTAVTHGYKTNSDNVDFSWYGRLSNIGGTSSLFALEIALQLGLRKIITCGITLDDKPHYYEDLTSEKSVVFNFTQSMDYSAWTNKFEHELKEYKDSVRATSGILVNLFGGIDG